MFSSLFLSKTLQILISRLREDGQMDAAAYKRFKRVTYKRFIIHLVLAIIPLIVAFNAPDVSFTLKSILYIGSYLVMLSFFMDHYKLASRYVVLYMTGNRVYGKTKSSHKGSSSFPWTVEYEFEVDGQTYRGDSGKITPALEPFKHREGQDIVICYNPNNPDDNAPLLPSLKQVYHLQAE